MKMKRIAVFLTFILTFSSFMVISVSAATLKNGSAGTQVYALQYLLKYQYTVRPSQNCNPGTIDGKFGNSTETAVRNFQKASGLSSVDGIVGSGTWKALTAGINLKKGQSGDPVYALQHFLRYIGFYPSSAAIDNFYGETTETSVRNFQTAMSLKVDGVVGSDTWAKLYSY